MMIRDSSSSGGLIIGPETMANVLLERSAWVYARLAQAEAYGVRVGEVTLTETLLLDLREALPGLQVTVYTQRQEARTGADWQWEWWFHGSLWFGIRVQAKLLKENSSGTAGYDLGFRSGKSKVLQLDLLTKDADASGLAAAYVLYNGPELDPAFEDMPWNCTSLAKCQLHFGISFLPAASARRLLDAGTLDVQSVAAASRPWACLFRCAAIGGCDAWPDAFRKAGPLDRAVARAFLLAEEEGSLLSFVGGDRIGHREVAARSVDEKVRRLRRAAPPPYVARIRGRAPEAGFDSEIDAALPEKVGAVTIIEDEQPERRVVRRRRSLGGDVRSGRAD